MRPCRKEMDLIRTAIFAGLCLLLCFALLFPCTSIAADYQIELEEDAWTWQPGEIAGFSGTLHGDLQPLSGGTLHVDILQETGGETIGKIVFTTVGDKKIKARKQSASVHLDELTGEVLPFSGVWYIPEDYSEHHATLILTAEDLNGQPVVSLQANPGADSYASNGGRLLWKIPFDMDQIIWIAGGACLLIWTGALARMLLRGRRTQRTAPHHS